MSEPSDDLAAIESIKILKARYFRYLDLKKFDDLEALFTDDALLWFEGMTPDWIGIQPAIAMIGAAVEHVTTIHHGHMPEIERTGPASAHAIWAMEDRLLAIARKAGAWSSGCTALAIITRNICARTGNGISTA